MLIPTINIARGKYVALRVIISSKSGFCAKEGGLLGSKAAAAKGKVPLLKNNHCQANKRTQIKADVAQPSNFFIKLYGCRYRGIFAHTFFMSTSDK